MIGGSSLPALKPNIVQHIAPETATNVVFGKGRDASVETIYVFCMPIGEKSSRFRCTGGTELKCFGYIVQAGCFVDPPGVPWASHPGSPGDAQWWLIPATRLSLCSRTLGCSGGPRGSLPGVTSPLGVQGDTRALVRQMEYMLGGNRLVVQHF